jgi:hypothetical protein
MTPEDEEFARIEAEINRRQGDTSQPASVQEPIGYFTVNDYDMWEQIDGTSGKPLYERPAAQPVPVKTYHDGKPWLVQPKPWVGLTDEEVTWAVEWNGDRTKFVRAIEAKLREKNGGAA